MLKRIAVCDLRQGMYIQELCGSWMEHPFWRNSFTLNDPRDIRRIADSGIKEVWIDTARGADVLASSEPAVDSEHVAAEVEQALVKVVATPVPQRVPMGEELVRATRLCESSRGAVTSMFAEVRMGRAIQGEEALSLVASIADSVMRNPGALISIARLKTKDDYTYMHSVAVCALMIALARRLELDEDAVRAAGLAGLLHDLGKAMIPPSILNKPGKLSDAEFEIVKSHPREGHLLLHESNGVSPEALEVCLHHHEKVDGSGYPDRLVGGQISQLARMAAVCDVYDAITSNRAYKVGWDPSEAVRKMAEWSKGHFDETIFRAFVRSVGIYPVGSLVRLESGRLAVVLEPGEKTLLEPIVKVFYSTRSDAFIKPERIDLSRESRDRIIANEDPTRWHFKRLDELWRGGV